MYPLCCIDIRNFLNQFYFFANDDFSHSDVIDETLKDVSAKLRLRGPPSLMLLIYAGAGRPAFAKSMRYSGGTAFFTILGSDRPNSDQLGTFRASLS